MSDTCIPAKPGSMLQRQVRRLETALEALRLVHASRELEPGQRAQVAEQHRVLFNLRASLLGRLPPSSGAARTLQEDGTMASTYNITDKHGNEITAGLTGDEQSIRRRAREIATRRGEVVYWYDPHLPGGCVHPAYPVPPETP